MKAKEGLTLVEVLVAIALLGILGAAIVSFLPMLTQNTQAATIDTSQTHRVIAIFEKLAHDWSNKAAWDSQVIYDQNGFPVGAADYIRDELELAGISCNASLEEVSVERRRVIIECNAESGLPERLLRAEFGNPLPEEK